MTTGPAAAVPPLAHVRCLRCLRPPDGRHGRTCAEPSLALSRVILANWTITFCGFCGSLPPSLPHFEARRAHSYLFAGLSCSSTTMRAEERSQTAPSRQCLNPLSPSATLAGPVTAHEQRWRRPPQRLVACSNASDPADRAARAPPRAATRSASVLPDSPQTPLQGGLVSFDATMRGFLRSHRTALPLARPSSAIALVAVLCAS